MAIAKDIESGTRIRVKRGSAVKSTISGEPQISKRAQVVTVHSVDPGWCSYVGYVSLGGLDRGGVDLCVDSLLRDARHLPSDVVDALELLGAAVNATEVMDLAETCSCLRISVREGVLEVQVEVRPPSVQWSGAGSYWRWTEVSNVEIVA